VTRLARAQREIGLAAGEFPARRGYPPSMFALLPRLFERAGRGASGSITAFYSVLVEGDDMNEPVADEVRSLLDGHIVLSRQLAERGQYPAIDVLASLSRVMSQVADERHVEVARRLRAILAKYNDIELLVQLGEYERGHDAAGDEALDKIARIRDFLKQGMHERIPFAASLDELTRCVA
jgi:type III secretion protein N (ATPase)